MYFLLISASIEFTESTYLSDSKYLLSEPTPLTDISDFQASCLDQGGYLAEIGNQEEYDFIMAFVEDTVPNRRQTALVGASDQATEGTWMLMNSGQAATFFSWNRNKGNRGRGRDCMYLVWNSRDSGMHDWKCQDRKDRRFLCEVPKGR